MSTTLASLIVKIGADVTGVTAGMSTLDKRVRRTKKQFGQLTDSTLRWQSALGVLAGAAGIGFAGAKIFQLGAGIEETASKFRTVLGPSTASAQKFLDGFASTAGLTNTKAQNLVATTAAIAQGMGFTQKASAGFAEEVTRLAADLTSFNDIPIAETSAAVQSALTGERESLKRLGIVILETDVQKKALATTGKKTASALTQQEKATATLALITERAGVAIGDLGRTMDSPANRARKLGTEFLSLRDSMAQGLLPAFTVVLGELEGGTSRFKDLSASIQNNSSRIAAWAKFAVAAFKTVAKAIAGVFTVAFSLGQVLGRLLTAAVQAMTGNFAGAKETLGDVVTEFLTMKATVMGVVDGFDDMRVAAGEAFETVRGGTSAVDAQAQALAEAAAAAEATTAAVLGLTVGYRELRDTTKPVVTAFEDLKRVAEEMNSVWQEAEDTAVHFKDVVVDAMGIVAQAIGRNASDMVRSIQDVIDQMKAMKDQAEHTSRSTQMVQAGATGFGLGSAIGGQTSNRLLGAAGGAAAGALAGSAFGPVGTVVGGLAGAIGGLFSSAKRRAEEAKRAARELFQYQQQLAQSARDRHQRDAKERLAAIEKEREARKRAAEEVQRSITSQFDAAIAHVQGRAASDVAAVQEQVRLASEQLQVERDQLRAQQQTVNELRSVIASLDGYANSLPLGSHSPLSPGARLEEARRQFDTMRALALGGDRTAAQSLAGAGDALLSASGGFNARAGGAFLADFERVQQTIAEVRGRFSAQLTVEEAQLAESRRHTEILEDQIAEMRAQILAIQQNARDVVAKLEQTRAADPPLSDFPNRGGGNAFDTDPYNSPGPGWFWDPGTGRWYQIEQDRSGTTFTPLPSAPSGGGGPGGSSPQEDPPISMQVAEAVETQTAVIVTGQDALIAAVNEARWAADRRALDLERRLEAIELSGLA